MEYMFRDLKANEIDVRVSSVTDKGVALLLYKDARVDQNILDETVGAMNWDRDHKELKGNVYAGIGIWNDEQKRLVWKWDAGKESFTEAEKGEASDSFKRAGFNWGIGRELYTSPFMWIPAEKCKIYTNKQGKLACSDKFIVEAIEIKNKEITGLAIKNISLKPNDTVTSQRVFVYRKVA